LLKKKEKKERNDYNKREKKEDNLFINGAQAE
jgi:hypothetical protein